VGVKKSILIAVVAAPLAALLLFVMLIPTGVLWGFARPALHKHVINRYAAVYKFDPLFVMALVKAESGFSWKARSHRGAVGLMQLMPETGMEMAAREGLSISRRDLDNPEINIHLGIHYLSLLRQEFGDDVRAILAAYNAGPVNARLWRGAGPLDISLVTFPETREFVRRVLWTYSWLKRLQRVKNVFS
jgi:soluble lytic murein transglycosylase